jgi:hypothetical protein
MSTNNIPEGLKRPARKADLTGICERISKKKNLVASTSLNPIGFRGLLQG